MDVDPAVGGVNNGGDLASDELERAFWGGVVGNADSARLVEIGNELSKVRIYANEHKVDDILSRTVVHLALSAYFAGVSPLIRIESALLIAKGLENEYAFSLAARAYIEVAGRIHKGVRLWRAYEKDPSKIAQFAEGVGRLLAKYHPKGAEKESMFKGDGYNVMTLVQSLEDHMPEIEEVYGNLSSYVHGGFEEQMFFRKSSWLSHLKGESNFIINRFESTVIKLKEVVKSDFDLLLKITKIFRDRYDEDHDSRDQNQPSE